MITAFVQRMKAPVSTAMSVITEPGHSLSHVYNQNTSVSHDCIFALTFDIHSCSHHTARNMRPVVDSGAAIHVCPSWHGFSPLSAPAKQLSIKTAGGDALHHLGSKTESCVCPSLKCQVNYEVPPVVTPIISVDVLTNKGVLVVFGVEGNSSFIQLLDGQKISMIRENGAMVLNATLVDRRNMTCDLVALVCSDCSASSK